MTKAPRKDVDFSNLVIFPSPPGPHRGNPMTKAMTPPGQTNQSAQQKETAQLASSQNQQASQMMMGAQQQSTPAPNAASNFNQYAQLPSAAQGYSNVSMGGGFPAATPATTPAANTASTVSQALTGLGAAGKGGPGNPTNLSDAAWTPMSQANSQWLMPGLTSNLPMAGIAGSPSTNLPPLGGTPAAPAPKNSSPSLTGFDPNQFNNLSSLTNSLNQQFPNLGPAVRAAAPTFNSNPPTPPVTPPATPATTPPAAPATQPAADTTPMGGSTTISGGATGTTGTTGTTSTTSTTPTTPATQNWAQAGVDANMGKEAFASAAMNSKQIMQQVLPGVDTSMINSSSVQKAITNLQQSLVNPNTGQPYQAEIAQMTSDLNQGINDGAFIGPMLTKYIQYKDVSLNAIHKAQIDAQAGQLKTDFADPVQATLWTRYNDYLNNIYTAQNASYADFFNQSVTTYTNTLNAASSVLNSTITAYSNLLTPQYTGLETDYTNIRQSLMDAYTTAQDAPIKTIQLAELNNQLALSNYQLLQAGAPTIGDWITPYNQATTAGVYFTNVKPTASKPTGNVGQLSPSVTDLTQAIDNLAMTYPKTGMQGAIMMVGSGMQKALDGAASPDSAIKLAANYVSMIEHAASTPGNTGVPVFSQAQAQQLMQTIGTTVGKSVYNALYNTTSGKDNTGVAKSAIVDAYVGSGTGFMGWGGTKVPTLAQFTSKYGTTLTPGLANELWNAIDTEKSLMAAQVKNNPQAYGQMTLEQAIQAQAQTVNAMTSPSTIADFIGSKVASLFGAINPDVTTAMNPVQQYDPATDPSATGDFGTNTFGTGAPVDTSTSVSSPVSTITSATGTGY
jgi:hypothetical protein